jgi:hypothetical protein
LMMVHKFNYQVIKHTAYFTSLGSTARLTRSHRIHPIRRNPNIIKLTKHRDAVKEA